LFGHDLFGKPLHTLPDHALVGDLLLLSPEKPHNTLGKASPDGISGTRERRAVGVPLTLINES
jgi:hypothetical protein